tara:strand:+ start:1438 stop:1611 length:174 start_codon:yes stop_codon:yes gene_type:complete
MKNKLIIEKTWEEGRAIYRVSDNNTLYVITSSLTVAENTRNKLREEYRREKENANEI